MSTPQVDHVLPEVSNAMPLWASIRDVLAGQAAIKLGGVKYVPQPNPDDKSDENNLRYQSYLTRGSFMNFTSRTLQGMVGAVFGKDPQVVLPTELEVLHTDVDGGAVTMDQQAKEVLSEIIAIGRGGLLTDYPNVERASRKDVLDKKVRPTIHFYYAENIINWRYRVKNGLRQLCLVVLSEKYTQEDDGFKEQQGDQWRVLRLEADDTYTVQIYQKDKAGQIVEGQKFTPKKADGKPFDYITFEFIGSANNDGGIDSAPLLDLANLNIAHFRNSCDFEEMVYQLGQPTPVITGLDQNWVDEVLKGKVILGSTKALMLPEKCEAFLLQIDESQLALSAMEHKERQAVALGARLVQSQQVARTAKEAGMEEASEQSLLLSSAKNVNSAYKRAIDSAALFAGVAVKPEMGYFLNTDFDILRLDAPGRAQLLAEWQRGALTFSEYRSVLKRAGVATLDDEQAQEELDTEAERMAARMGMDPTLQNDGVTPQDKNAPKDKPGTPRDKAGKARKNVGNKK